MEAWPLINAGMKAISANCIGSYSLYFTGRLSTRYLNATLRRAVSELPQSLIRTSNDGYLIRPNSNKNLARKT